MDALTWEQVINLIADYYSQDAAYVEQTLTGYGVQIGDVKEAFKLLEGTAYSLIYNNDGTIREAIKVAQKYSTETGAAAMASALNSNVQTAVKTSIRTPLQMQIQTAASTAPVTFKAGLTSAAGATGEFVSTVVAPATVAAAVGISAGMLFDKAMYEAGFNWLSWAGVDMESLDPATWRSITVDDDSFAAGAFNIVFGWFPELNKSQMYVDQDAYAYMMWYMQNIGMFSGGTTSVVTPVETDLSVDLSEYFNTPIVLSNSVQYDFEYEGETYTGTMYPTGDTKMLVIKDDADPTYSYIVFFTSNASNITYSQYELGVEYPVTNPIFRNYTYNDKTVYYGAIKLPHIEVVGGSYYNNEPITPWSSYTSLDSDVLKTLFWNCLYNTTTTTGIEGTGIQDGATVPDLSSAQSTADTLALLEELYPTLWENAVTEEVAQPDGSTKIYTYLPVPFPQPNPEPTAEAEADPSTEPVTGGQTQADPDIDPETSPETQIQYIIKLITTPTEPNEEDTGEGNTPAVVTPTGSAEALYRVWNPTEAQLNQFGGWLWSSNFVDQLLKVFNDPMQAIIGLHKVFVTPSVGGTDTITVGYLDSGVSSNYINEQYVTVDCGSVSFPESYNSVFDYAPFTDVSLYLPFIGFVRLDVNDITRGTINVKYHVDVLTGACLAEVSVTRDTYGGVIYTYTGNCSVTYPLSSGSYMGIIGTVASIAGGIAGTLATGGAAAPMMLGAAAGALNAHTNVERSGSLSGNAGAMGIKKPYLVISRPQTNLASDFETYIGKPANYTTALSNASGFVSCTEVHLINCNATDSELDEIDALLKSGIII